MKLHELPDDFTEEQFMQLDRESLDTIEYSSRKWICNCKGCTNWTAIRDYGIMPYVYHPRKGWGWTNLERVYFLCGKHNKFFKRLLKSFSKATVEQKLLDYSVIYKLSDPNENNPIRNQKQVH